MVKKGAARAAADKGADISDELLPSTNGSQHDLHQFLRALAGDMECLEADEVYLITTGAAMASGGKLAVMSVKHNMLLRAGYIAKEKYGILNPLPTDEYTALYSAAFISVSAGIPIPNASVVAALPAEPDATNLPDNHVIAPDRIMLVDIKLKATILKLITSVGRRRHYADAVGPSGMELLRKLIADSKLIDSAFTQTTLSRRIKAQMAEVMKIRLTEVSLDQFDEIKDTLEDLNSQLPDPDDRLGERTRTEHYIKLITQLKSSDLKSALLLDLNVNRIKHGDLEGTLNAIARVLSAGMAELEVDRLESSNSRALAFKKQDARKNNLTSGKPP